VGRRARWHQFLSRYDISVGYIPGKENDIADIMSRWAYPASQAQRDISKHGTMEDENDVEELLRQEKLDECECMVIQLKPEHTNVQEKKSVIQPISQQNEGEEAENDANPPNPVARETPKVDSVEGEEQTHLHLIYQSPKRWLLERVVPVEPSPPVNPSISTRHTKWTPPPSKVGPFARARRKHPW
jgi:hypothetical protein